MLALSNLNHTPHTIYYLGTPPPRCQWPPPAAPAGIFQVFFLSRVRDLLIARRFVPLQRVAQRRGLLA